MSANTDTRISGPSRPLTNGRARIWTSYRWEITKLAAQARTRASLGACGIAPFIFMFLLDRQDRVPKDTLFGRYVHDSGYATPLMLLGFAAQWVFPLLTSLVAGDIFASEDQHGTWKTILTRSHGRTQIFWGKTFAAATFAVLILLALSLSSLTAGVLLVGHQPLESLTGTLIPSGHAAWLVLAAWSTSLLPAPGIHQPRDHAVRPDPQQPRRDRRPGSDRPDHAAVRIPQRRRPDPPPTAHHPVRLLARPAGRPAFYGPLIRGAILSAVYITVCLTVAFTALRRRDITGG